MAKRTINTHPLVDQLKAAGGGTVSKFSAFIGRAANGRIELYSDLSLKRCVEIDDSDVIHVVGGEKPTDRSLVFVRSDAQVSIRFDTTAARAAAADLGGCGCAPTDDGGSIARLAGSGDGGGGVPDIHCETKKVACESGCSLKYFDDPMMLQACKDNCDAAYRLCKDGFGVFGGGRGIIMF